jgi:hypothetical protein
MYRNTFLLGTPNPLKYQYTPLAIAARSVAVAVCDATAAE